MPIILERNAHYSSPLTFYTCRFDLPGEAWHLTPRPPGILEAIEHHLEFLTKQLTSDEISKSFESEDHSSPAGIVLQDILSLSTVLARVAGVAENYSELVKGHDLISFTVEMVQNLMKLVREKREIEIERERDREGGRLFVFSFQFLYNIIRVGLLTSLGCDLQPCPSVPHLLYNIYPLSGGPQEKLAETIYEVRQVSNY